MITNKWFAGDADLTDACALRREVFVNEQRVPEEEEFDGLDGQSMHLVLYEDGAPIAAGRIWHDGKTFRVGRCCVVKRERAQGVGDLLVKLLLRRVMEYRPSEVRVHAQRHAEAFYARYGFAPCGKEFLEAGIPHIAMRAEPKDILFPSRCGER